MDTGRIFTSRVSLEAEARFLHWGGLTNLSESSYMAGPRVPLFRHRQITFNAKLMFGRANITVPPKHTGSGSYLAYAPGALVEYRLNRRMFIRGDYERQFWPGWKGIRTAVSDGTGALTPNGLSVGVSYALR